MQSLSDVLIYRVHAFVGIYWDYSCWLYDWGHVLSTNQADAFFSHAVQKRCAKIMLMIRNMGIIMIISPIWPRFCITYSFHLADAFNNLFHRCSVVFAVIGSNSKHHQLKLSKLIRIEREREKKARSTETTLNNRLVWPHMRNIEKKIGESMARTHP